MSDHENPTSTNPKSPTLADVCEQLLLEQADSLWVTFDHIAEKLAGTGLSECFIIIWDQRTKLL
jgi:hypothetical protein